MKILHVCTQEDGGAGIAALRLHKGLLNLKINSKMLVLKSNSGSKEVYSFFGSLNKNQKRVYYYFEKIKRYLANNKNKKRPKDLEIFTYYNNGFDISKHKLVREADIINLHWIANFVDYKKFFSNFKNKPIVWTLHDMNPFTGGCHHSDHCKKYTTHCGKCFQLNSKKENDKSYKNFQTKKKIFYNLNLTIVSPSKWLLNCATKSTLFNKYENIKISNAVPINTFKIIKKESAKEILNIKQKQFVIMFCAKSINQHRKGSNFLIEALKILKNEKNISNITLLMVGSNNNGSNNKLNNQFDIRQIGYLTDENLLSVCYNASDLFVIPSLAENLPNTILESMSCGNPAIGFNIGGIPELIKNNKNGFLTNFKDSRDLANNILWMIEHPNERKQMGINARKNVEKNFSQEFQARNYIKLYKKLLN
jgi:glycosyltransferase involved in cell wall biosynthesis